MRMTQTKSSSAISSVLSSHSHGCLWELLRSAGAEIFIVQGEEEASLSGDGQRGQRCLCGQQTGQRSTAPSLVVSPPLPLTVHVFLPTFPTVLSGSDQRCGQPELQQAAQHPQAPDPCGQSGLRVQLCGDRSPSACGRIQAGRFLLFIASFSFLFTEEDSAPTPRSVLADAADGFKLKT